MALSCCIRPQAEYVTATLNWGALYLFNRSSLTEEKARDRFRHRSRDRFGSALTSLSNYSFSGAGCSNLLLLLVPHPPVNSIPGYGGKDKISGIIVLWPKTGVISIHSSTRKAFGYYGYFFHRGSLDSFTASGKGFPSKAATIKAVDSLCHGFLLYFRWFEKLPPFGSQFCAKVSKGFTEHVS